MIVKPRQQEIAAPSNRRKFAGLIVDMQYDPTKTDNFHNPYSPIGFDGAVEKIKRQIELFLEIDIPFAFVAMGNLRLNPQLEEIVKRTGAPKFGKGGYSAYTSPEAEEFLREFDSVIISGYNLGVCVRASVYDTIQNGKKAYLAMDALLTEEIVSDMASMQAFMNNMREIMSINNGVLLFNTTDSLIETIRRESS